MRRTTLFLVAVATTTILAGVAYAAPNAPSLITIANDSGDSWVLSADDLGGFTDTGNGTFTIDGTGNSMWSSALDVRISDWMIEVNEDPFVNQVFGFLNTGATSTFTITTEIMVAPVGPSSVMGGSTGGSVTDGNSDGVGGLTTVSPDPFYVGIIDGSPVAGTALHPYPFSVAPFPDPGDTVPIPTTSFGLPGPTVPGPAVTTSIGIRNKFELAGGDSVASTNFFVVEVPEPATISLLTLGGLALLKRRRSGTKSGRE
jgi:hypothetical protein